ncbi:hypothetical protein FACS1894141_6860 [Spirochaetia bacterium]|nr:hypothetical protein FACS1894141_6860 [Spirochaetia bacterium]
MKVLFITYYYDPYPGVGAKRISYWAQNLNQCAADMEVSVITATEGAKSSHGVTAYYVEDKKTGIWKYFLASPNGASWGYHLKKWLQKNTLNYDVIIFTGGPFLQFMIASWLKKKTSAKIIFDFRDPFADNPGFGKTIPRKIKNVFLSFIEQGFVKCADLIISVNPWCLSLIHGIKNKKTLLIDNGFDEHIVDEVITNQCKLLPDTKKIRFVYAGKFYYTAPTVFFDVINHSEYLRENIEVVYVGDENHWLEPYRDTKWLIELGRKSYKDTLNIISCCDYGLLFPIGHPFQSTTKIFDYMAMGVRILAISDIVPEDGVLVAYLRQYFNGNYIENTQEQIAVFLAAISKKNIEDAAFPIEKYSRKKGLELLIAALRDLMLR